MTIPQAVDVKSRQCWQYGIQARECRGRHGEKKRSGRTYSHKPGNSRDDWRHRKRRPIDSGPNHFLCHLRPSRLLLGDEFQRRLHRNRRSLVLNRQILMLNRASIN